MTTTTDPGALLDHVIEAELWAPPLLAGEAASPR